jgi:hypothetical protein
MQRAELGAVAAVSQRERVRIALARGGPMDQADKVAALRDAVRALDAAGARSALVGGVAVGLRSGVPRATLDTDLAVLSTVERAAVVRALLGVGFTVRGEFEHSVNFRHMSGEPMRLCSTPSSM